MTTEEKLLAMKQEIKEDETRKARLEGELDSIHKQLSAMGLKGVDEAEAELKDLKKEITDLKGKLESQVAKLTKSYDWKTLGG